MKNVVTISKLTNAVSQVSASISSGIKQFLCIFGYLDELIALVSRQFVKKVI